MRNLGGVLLLAGCLGFYYASTQLDTLAPVPSDVDIGEALDLPAGRWTMVRYACAGAAGLGLILALYPKGR